MIKPTDKNDAALLVKPPPDRLYGRQHGHALRARQQRLLDETLPRLRFAALSELPFRDVGLEVGFGGGEHAEAQIRANAESGLIACEVFENGICSLLSRLVPEGGESTAPLPPNLRLHAGDARVLLRSLPDASLARVFLLFPDPWPKTRHAKRRFVHPANVALVARALRPGGEWRIATDDSTYQDWVGEVMRAQSAFAPAEPTRARPEGWPPTRYEAKALRAGRAPLYWSFRRL